jgi:L-asparaginase
MNDELHAARFVRKTHTSRLDAFSSPASGRLGWVSEGRVFVGSRLDRLPAIPNSASVEDRRVALVTVALGDDGTLIRALPPGQFQGLVVEATGGGHVPVEVADALEAVARQVPVILASRTGAGETLSHTYGFPGSEIDLQRRGLIRAGWLDGLKAKALLTLLLRHGVIEMRDISAAFEPWGGGPRR